MIVEEETEFRELYSLFKRILHRRYKTAQVWWRTRGKTGMAADISVGVRKDQTIDVDIGDGSREGGDWNFNNLTLDEAQFLREELENAINRVKARQPRPEPAQLPLLPTLTVLLSLT